MTDGSPSAFEKWSRPEPSHKDALDVLESVPMPRVTPREVVRRLERRPLALRDALERRVAAIRAQHPESISLLEPSSRVTSGWGPRMNDLSVSPPGHPLQHRPVSSKYSQYSGSPGRHWWGGATPIRSGCSYAGPYRAASAPRAAIPRLEVRLEHDTPGREYMRASVFAVVLAICVVGLSVADAIVQTLAFAAFATSIVVVVLTGLRPRRDHVTLTFDETGLEGRAVVEVRCTRTNAREAELLVCFESGAPLRLVRASPLEVAESVPALWRAQQDLARSQPRT